MFINVDDVLKINPSFDLSDERRKILECLNSSRCFLNILGKAGTGKSALLKVICDLLKRYDKNVIVATTTGIASAILNSDSENINASTIHSTFHIKARNLLGEFKPSDISFGRTKEEYKAKREEFFKLIENTDFIIIDECSMMTADLFDYLIRELKYFSHGKIPNIILFGDIFQLPPVVKMNIDSIHEYYEKVYNSNIFYFSANEFIDLNFKTYVLDKNYRQKEDLDFLLALNHIRDGNQTDKDLDLINTRAIDIDEFNVNNDNAIHICSTNHECDVYNQTFLALLKTKIIKIQSKYTDGFYDTDEGKSNLYPDKLRLQIGEKVMITKNALPDENGIREYVNGDCGIVKEITKDYILVALKDRDVQVTRTIIEHYEYELKEVEGRIRVCSKLTERWSNFPLRVCYAITSYKSQGSTLDKGIIHLSEWIPPSGIYVSLSRFRHLDDFVLSRKITNDDIIVSKEAKRFMESANV